MTHANNQKAVSPGVRALAELAHRILKEYEANGSQEPDVLASGAVKGTLKAQATAALHAQMSPKQKIKKIQQAWATANPEAMAKLEAKTKASSRN